MSYRLERAERIDAGVRRIADEQLTAALSALDHAVDGDPVASIHDCRKRCKKVRGLIRSVRPTLGAEAYRSANTMLRDAARELAPFRDAAAMQASFGIMRSRSAHAVDHSVNAVDAALRERHATMLADFDRSDVETAREMIAGVRAESETWEFDHDGWEALGPGIAKSYRRGRRALDDLTSAPTPENSHELRKRVKYSWYHTRLIESAAPSVLSPLADCWHAVSDALGDAHDAAVLDEWITGDEDLVRDVPDTTPAIQMLAGFREVLERRAIGLASRLFAEPDDRYAARLGSYWESWERLGTEEPVGEVVRVWAEPG